VEWFLDLSERTSYIRIGLTYKKKQVCVKGVCVAILPRYKSKKNFKGDVIFYITLETACLYTNPRVGARGYKGNAQVP